MSISLIWLFSNWLHFSSDMEWKINAQLWPTFSVLWLKERVDSEHEILLEGKVIDHPLINWWSFAFRPPEIENIHQRFTICYHLKLPLALGLLAIAWDFGFIILISHRLVISFKRCRQSLSSFLVKFLFTYIYLYEFPLKREIFPTNDYLV